MKAPRTHREAPAAQPSQAPRRTVQRTVAAPERLDEREGVATQRRLQALTATSPRTIQLARRAERCAQSARVSQLNRQASRIDDSARMHSQRARVTQLLGRAAAAHDPSEDEADRVAASLRTDTDSGPSQAITRPPGAAALRGEAPLRRAIETRIGHGDALSPAQRHAFEDRLGADLGEVRVHADTQAAQLAGALHARAFTYGADIFFDTGEYTPGTAAGQALLAHELVHTVQQGASARTAEPPIQRSPVIQRATHLYPQIVDDFEYGDLIYGLSFTRTATIEALAQRHAPGGQDLPFARVADELNNVFIGTEMGARGGLDAYDSRSPNYQPSPEVEHQAGGFRQFLEDHPRYSPTQRDYHGMPLSTKERSWARINAACKAGLEYAVQSGHRIYFIIDEIDMVGVVKKRRYAEDTQTDIQPENRFAKFDGIGDAGNRDITPAELRWVYRQSQVSDDVRDRVTFWRDGRQAEPPWVSEPELWEQEYSHKELRSQDARDHADGVWTAMREALGALGEALDELRGTWTDKVDRGHFEKARWRSREKRRMRRQGRALHEHLTQELQTMRGAVNNLDGRLGRALDREATRLAARIEALGEALHGLLSGKSTQAIGPRIDALARSVAEELSRIEALQDA